MNFDTSGHTLLYLLLLILPVAALVSRRVPVLRLLLSLASWAVIFVLLAVVIGQREQFDPYVQQVARLLKLDDQNVIGKETHIRMSADGHFWARVTLDGVSRRMLVDSGATVTALSIGTAKAAALDVRKSVFPMILNTANGQVSAQTATVGELRLGDIAARDLSVVVSPAFGSTDVLGMNFLSKLKSWRVEGSTLILQPHNHQEFT
jgi:aspartyl protease family protein